MPILKPSTRSVVGRFHLVLVIASVCLTTVPRPVGGQRVVADNLEAAFLFRFTRFVEWPADAFPTANSPLTFGVVGDDFVAYTLSGFVHGKTINGRPLQVRRLRSGDDLTGSQVIFISASESRAADVMEGVRGSAVLTVSNLKGFCELGGMIRLFVEDNHVQFEVNLHAADQARLKVSSRVLTLAKGVHGKSR
jgi:hypothetical protein